MIWKKISLRVRIYAMLSSLVFVTLVGGLVMVWYTYEMQDLLTQIVDKNLSAFQEAEALETALVNQKGFVSYYFLDGDPDWLRQLGEYRQIFKERLARARTLVETDQQREALARIETEYPRYIRLKDQVIALYREGQNQRGSELHNQVRSHFFKIIELCEKYKNLHAEQINREREQSRSQAEKLRVIAGTAMLAVLVLAVLLAFVLVNHILGPVRRLALEANPARESVDSRDEVKALSRTVRGLIEDMDFTQSELERSRETLLQAEKMALVGKLAAGTAHSIRNPLTSVSMRLFSLSRSLDLSPNQKEDFEVISKEIRHIDTIVQNFLEFARPPKLKMQKVSPSDVVDAVMQLLQHRVRSYDVNIRVEREHPLREIQVDPEQLREALVNLVINACEAMKEGGLILIQEEERFGEAVGSAVVIRVIDNGPGIPESIQARVFDPFFTTKEEGTGLGLSIAYRVIQEHGGQLDVKSKEGEGTSFTITLPVRE